MSAYRINKAVNLTLVMELDVQIGPPEKVGHCVDGYRINYPIMGGYFSGQGIGGIVLPSGTDHYRLRPDGVGELDARYSLLTDRGEIINVHNMGLLFMTEGGKSMEKVNIWPLPEEHYHCTCSPRFYAPDGELSWLNQEVFIALVNYPVANRVSIRCFSLRSEY